MKKKLLLAFVAFPLWGMTQNQTAFLDVNNVKATVNVSGVLFNDHQSDRPGFEVPAGQGRHTIYAASLLIGAEGPGSAIHLSAQNAAFQQGNSDFQPGPVLLHTSDYATHHAAFNRVWKLTRQDILNHAFNYADPGYTAPEAILSWPAGLQVPTASGRVDAPYFDRNLDGVYNPQDGDYPLIKGDQAIYFIYNDDKPRNFTSAERLKVEIHVLVYAFDEPASKALSNTVFAEYTLYNRSSQAYENTYIGAYTDFDIGCHDNDYIGSNIRSGYYYGYNALGISESSCSSGVLGYDQPGDGNPQQAVIFLAGPYQTPDGMDNPLTTNVSDAIDSMGIPYAALGVGYGDGIVDNERLGLTNFIRYAGNGGAGTTPDAAGFYSYLRSRWHDGTPLYYGGTGYHTSQGVIDNGNLLANYIYPSTSDPLRWNTGGIVPPITFVWDEENEQNHSGDRVALGASGPFRFEAGSVHKFELAYLFNNYDLYTPNWDGLDLESEVGAIRDCFLSDSTPSHNTFLVLSDGVLMPEQLKFEVFPNPSAGEVRLRIPREMNRGKLEVMDLTGRLLATYPVNGQEILLDLAALPGGYYFLKLSDEKGTGTQRLLLAK